jgi:dCTP deaminase (EC 3.5.4.13)
LLDGNGRRRDTRDTLYTASPEVANRAAYLGTRLGLLTSVYGPSERVTQPPTGADKQADELWAVRIRDGTDKRRQAVPTPSSLLRQYRQRADMQTQEAAERLADASRSRLLKIEDSAHETVTHETLRRLRDAYSEAGVTTTRLDQILRGQVRFEKVTAVEKTDRTEPTYDLEVQPGGRAIENFVAGRGGVFLSNTAGLCDPGYQGQITLELSNLGAAPVALAPDMRISQLTFTELTSPAERPYGEDRGSKYQGQKGPQASRIGGDREFGGDQ